MTARESLEAILRAAISAVDAEAAVRRVLRRGGSRLEIAGRTVPPESGLWVLALGKAACAMARGVEGVAGERIRGGLVVTKDDHVLALERLPVLEAAHPVPDARGEVAAHALLRAAEGIPVSDVLLVLLSGGASALTACPLPGLDREALTSTTRVLLGCGASISEMNCVRKHLSALAGGRLAAATACSRIEVLAVSDVPGDRLDVIGSGPCHGDPSSFEDALAVVDRYGVRSELDARVSALLERGARGEVPESVAPGDPALARVRSTIVARNADARHAATRAAREQGIQALDLGERLSGEARDLGRRLAALGCAVAPVAGPVCLVAGGETTVTLRGDGRGGRSQELALAAALALHRSARSAHRPRIGRIALLAAGTDGTDGPTDAAGAFADAGTVARGLERGQSAEEALRRNDSYAFFASEGGLLRTGPTHTNVMDLALVRVEGAAAAEPG